MVSIVHGVQRSVIGSISVTEYSLVVFLFALYSVV